MIASTSVRRVSSARSLFPRLSNSCARTSLSLFPADIVALRLGLLSSPSHLRIFAMRLPMGAPYAPCAKKGKAAPRSSPRRNRLPAHPQAPRKGVAGEQTPRSRSNLFRPTFLQFGCERSTTYPLARLINHERAGRRADRPSAGTRPGRLDWARVRAESVAGILKCAECRPGCRRTKSAGAPTSVAMTLTRRPSSPSTAPPAPSANSATNNIAPRGTRSLAAPGRGASRTPGRED